MSRSFQNKFLTGSTSLTTAEKGIARANIGADILSGFRNKLINGNFDIWQRATTHSTTGYGSVDRWASYHIGSSKVVSRQSFALGQTDVPGEPTYFARTVVTSVVGAGNLVSLSQNIESVRTLAGKKATLTFWAKADAAKNIGVLIQQYFGTGGSPSASVNASTGLKALTTAWQKFTVVVDLPSIAGKTLGSNGNDGLFIAFYFDAGASVTQAGGVGQQSGTFDIAHVSLVEGDATAEADPFSPRHIQQELELCLRYYEKFDFGVGAYVPTTGQAYSTANVLWPLTYARKRGIPSITIPTDIQPLSATGVNQTVTSHTPANVSEHSARVTTTTTNTNMVAGSSVMFFCNTASAITIDAEL